MKNEDHAHCVAPLNNVQFFCPQRIKLNFGDLSFYDAAAWAYLVILSCGEFFSFLKENVHSVAIYAFFVWRNNSAKISGV